MKARQGIFKSKNAWLLFDFTSIEFFAIISTVISLMKDWFFFFYFCYKQMWICMKDHCMQDHSMEIFMRNFLFICIGICHCVYRPMVSVERFFTLRSTRKWWIFSGELLTLISFISQITEMLKWGLFTFSRGSKPHPEDSRVFR